MQQFRRVVSNLISKPAGKNDDLIEIYSGSANELSRNVRLLAGFLALAIPPSVYSHLSYKYAKENDIPFDSFHLKAWNKVVESVGGASKWLLKKDEEVKYDAPLPETTQSRIKYLTGSALFASIFGLTLTSYFTSGYIARIAIRKSEIPPNSPILSILQRRNKGSKPPDLRDFILGGDQKTINRTLEEFRHLPLQVTALNKFGFYKTHHNLRFADFEKCRSGVGRGRHLYANLMRLDGNGRFKQYHIMDIEDMKTDQPKLYAALHSIIPWAH